MVLNQPYYLLRGKAACPGLLLFSRILLVPTCLCPFPNSHVKVLSLKVSVLGDEVLRINGFLERRRETREFPNLLPCKDTSGRQSGDVCLPDTGGKTKENKA